jgi:hypothetical protein
MKLPKCYVVLIPLQEAIGWGHLIHDHLSTVWAEADLQQDYMFRAHKKIKFDCHQMAQETCESHVSKFLQSVGMSWQGTDTETDPKT